VEEDTSLSSSVLFLEVPINLKTREKETANVPKTLCTADIYAVMSCYVQVTNEQFHKNIASDRLNSFLAGCSSEAKQAKCLTVLVQDYTVDQSCAKASVVGACGMEMSWKNTSEMFPVERTQLRRAFRLPSVSIQLSESTGSLQTSSQVLQP